MDQVHPGTDTGSVKDWRPALRYNTDMPNRAKDWLTQAKRSLALVDTCMVGGFHEYACFAAQQAAEMAVKALHQSHGQEAWGHVVRRLLEDVPRPIAVPAQLIDSARVLDQYYMPTRYPNGHPAGAPAEHYGEQQSRDAREHARQIVEFCRLQMAGS